MGLSRGVKAFNSAKQKKPQLSFLSMMRTERDVLRINNKSQRHHQHGRRGTEAGIYSKTYLPAGCLLLLTVASQVPNSKTTFDQNDTTRPGSN